MAINVRKEYNILNECKYIRNKDHCIHDTNTGYEALFNRDRAGWNVYSGIEVSHTEGYFLWGIASADGACSIGREYDMSETFEADYFGDFEVDMLIRVDEDMTPNAPDTFTARIKWKMVTDVATWRTDAIKDFTVQADGLWHRYRVNLLEEQYWVGDCDNFIFYPMIDGLKNVEVLIRRFAFRSDYNYKCKQPACAGNRSYVHPCPHIGAHARAYGDIRRSSVSIDDNNSKIGVSIDGYPAKYIDIDLSHANDPWSVAQAITMKLNAIGIGGYKYAECIYDPIEQVFSIYSGTKGKDGSVAIYHGGEKDAAEELGFFHATGQAAWRAQPGTDPVDGYLPNYYKLPATLLYRLPSSTTTIIDYEPNDPLVEIGRDDLLSLPTETVFPEGYIVGLLMIDVFGRCTYDGTINEVRYRGELASDETDSVSKIFLMRPVSDFSFEAVESVTLESSDLQNGVYARSVSWDVRPGDVFGLWQCLPAIHGVDYLEPEKLYKYSWIERIVPDLKVGDTVGYTPTNLRFYGYESLPVFGQSAQRMLDIGLEAELRYEYGVSHVAVIGEQDTDCLNVNLADLSTTQVTIRTPNTTVGPVPITETDFYIDAEGDDEYFYIDFWFPGVIKNIAQVRTLFEYQHNLRGFCWEFYVEPENRIGYSWGTTYLGVETTAPLLGSEGGWRRMTDPDRVLLDSEKDVSTDLYLGWNYVTDDPDDYFPDLSEEEQTSRLNAAKGIYWQQLDQIWEGVKTRGLRLNCWKAADNTINEVDIFAFFPSTQSLLHSVEAFGISGPLVFDTEKYDIINVEGDKYSSSWISRVQTEDYIYGMEFSLEESDLAVAPVGTTMSKIEIDIGGLAAKIEQIKVIPQHLAVQVKAEGDEPVEEITDLSWGMPSDGSDWTYGPTKVYNVCNDRGHEAKLILGVADPLAVDQACVFYSKLNSYESLSDPHRGLTAHLIEAPDYAYENSRAVNYRSIVYSILDQDPVNWYSSTTTGVVYQTLVSGCPFTDTTLWSEPANPHATNWKLYNWAKTDDVSVTSGSLNFAVDSRPLDAEGYMWRNPTYFQSLTMSEALTIETQLDGNISQYENVDSAAGIVLFDNEDRSKYIRIDRYMGNGITTSGYTQFAVPHGDYITYGDNSLYSTSGGFTLLDLQLAKKTNMLLKMVKAQDRVEVAYKTPWEGWTTASAFNIKDWSDDLRMGLFVSAVDRVRDSSERVVGASFNYVAYMRSAARKTDFFDYEHDFEDFTYTSGLWTAHNPQDAEILRTSASGIHILKYIGGGGYTYFDKSVNTPALETPWGGTRDMGAIKFRLFGYDNYVLASGNYSAGTLLRDTGNYDNYIQFNLRRSTLLEVNNSGASDYFTLTEPVQPASGIWMRLHKVQGMYVPSYSYDGTTYTAVSGYRITGWSDDYPVSMIFSTDLPEVRFDNLEVGTSQTGANWLAAEFDPEISLYNVWGRQITWNNIQYTASGTPTGWTPTKPDSFKFLSFEKSTSKEVETGVVKFIPDVWKSDQLGLLNASYEVGNAGELLFDRSSQVRPEVTQTTSSGTWPSGDASSKGMPQYDYPVLIFDLGRTYEIGRCPLVADNAKGRFSRSIGGFIRDVSWDGDPVDVCGFDRQCLLSSSDQCTADKTDHKPVMTFTDGERKMKYYAGPCDGVEAPAGLVYKACPMYSLGQARWMMMEWNNYLDATISGGSIWFFAPITGHPKGGPYKLTDFDPWWVIDYGQLNWIYEDNAGKEYALIYSYPGLNIEGSCYFNPNGSEYWRLAPDKDWTYEDKFSIDLRFWQPENLDNLIVRVGRDPRCYYEFTVTGTLTEDWSTHTWLFKEGNRVIRSMEGLRSRSTLSMMTSST